MEGTSIIQLQNYNIYLGNLQSSLVDFLKESTYSKYWVLVDENTATHCLPILEASLKAASKTVHLIQIESGEINKTLTTCQDIWKSLLEGGTDRKALVINLGGGVIGDMGGFCASTYKRGIDFIQIPTTLLAQVDASIGGKLGVDFEHVKNIIGCFNNPQAVFIDPVFLNSLPERQVRNGFAEVIKHALIDDEDYWNDLLKIEDFSSINWKMVIYRSLLVKKRIVEEDPFEAGLRKVLNFGHTIGHAIESWSLAHDNDPLLHGEAIALGMEAELRLSIGRGEVNEQEVQTVLTFMNGLYSPYHRSLDDYTPVMEYMKNDKKNEGGQLNFTLLEKLGKAIFNQAVGEEEVYKVVENVMGVPN